MKYSRKVLALAAAAAVLLMAGVGCAEKTVAFKDPAAGETLTVTVGKPFSLNLQSNPTTGYQWKAEFDGSELSMQGSDYQPDPNDEKVVGRGGRDTFTFTLLKPGSAKLKMIYARPWNGGDTADVREYTVTGK